MLVPSAAVREPLAALSPVEAAAHPALQRAVPRTPSQLSVAVVASQAVFPAPAKQRVFPVPADQDVVA